jgi:hypothetical protein
MRYLILAALIVATTSSGASHVMFPPRYEMPACDEIDGPKIFVINADGTVQNAMRIEHVGPDAYQVVGYESNRIFCSRMDN